ncbi:MAG: hypothetical protein ACPHUL_00135 [Marinomonas gallaica]
MNLAELIINTIKEEAAETRRVLLEEIKKDGVLISLEQEVSSASNILGQSFVSPKVRKSRSLASVESRSKNKLPNASYDEEEMEAWVKNNHSVCTVALSAMRSGSTGSQVARSLNREVRTGYSYTGLMFQFCVISCANLDTQKGMGITYVPPTNCERLSHEQNTQR